MSRQLFACRYCGRNNFKTKRGLQQHVEASTLCNCQARAARAQNLRLSIAASERDLDNIEANFGAGEHYESVRFNEATAETQSSEAEDEDGIIMEAEDDAWAEKRS